LLPRNSKKTAQAGFVAFVSARLGFQHLRFQPPLAPVADRRGWQSLAGRHENVRHALRDHLPRLVGRQLRAECRRLRPGVANLPRLPLVCGLGASKMPRAV